MYENILNTCLELHQANTGSHQPDVSEADYTEKYNFLLKRIQEWKPMESIFDEAVLTLMLVTIKECEENK